MEKAVTDIAAFRDSFGVIVQMDGDGADSCNRIALYYSCLAILKAQEDDLNRPPEDGFYISTTRLTANLPHGRYARHPDRSKWYSDMENVTRDQMAPMIAAMALFGTKTMLKQHLRLRLPRLLTHFSTRGQDDATGGTRRKLPDLPSPGELANMIRGLNLVLLWPLLLLLDAAVLIEVYLLTEKNGEEGKVLLDIAVAKKSLSTPLSYLSRVLLKRKKAAFTTAVLNYHSGPRNGIPPLAALTIAALDAV